MEKNWIDFEKLPSDELEQLLRSDCNEPEKAILSDASILQICKILTERRRVEHPKSIIDVEKKWEELLKYYLAEDS